MWKNCANIIQICANISQILLNIVQILLEYCSNILYILCKYWALCFIQVQGSQSTKSHNCSELVTFCCVLLCCLELESKSSFYQIKFHQCYWIILIECKRIHCLIYNWYNFYIQDITLSFSSGTGVLYSCIEGITLSFSSGPGLL